MTVESTLLIVKPDAVRRGLVGEILSRIERKGLRIDAIRTQRVDRNLAERHYAEHRDVHLAHHFLADCALAGGDVVEAEERYGRSLEAALDYGNVAPIAEIPEIIELNIGHSIIARAVIVGIEQAVREMKELLSRVRGS